MSQLLQIYRSVGNEHYGAEISKLAPYFGTINPQFRDLRPGHCLIAIPNTPAVHIISARSMPSRCATARS
jgi:hypothetical protein